MRELAAVVALDYALRNVPVVARNAGNTEQSGFFVQHIAHLSGRHAFLFRKERNDRRVERAGARSHHKAVERGKAHTRVDNLAFVYRRDG